MSQSVELSDELILTAKQAAQPDQSNPSALIERWATLGRVVEQHLQCQQAVVPITEVWEAIQSADSELGRSRLRKSLEASPFPHFEPVSGHPRYFKKIDQDGNCEIGRFQGRQFIVETPLTE